MNIKRYAIFLREKKTSIDTISKTFQINIPFFKSAKINCSAQK